MTKDEAAELLAKEGLDVVGVKVFPQQFGSFDAWVEVLNKAADINPDLGLQMTQENIDKANKRIEAFRLEAERLSEHEHQNDPSD